MSKKKGKKDKAKKEVFIDDINTTELTRENLEALAVKLKEELDREREQRSYFQVERDKISTFWEVSRNQIEDLQNQVRNKEREREEENEKSQEKEKEHTQKVKYLQYEQTQELNTLRAESEAALRNARALHFAQEAQLLQDKRELRSKLVEQELAAQEELRKVKINDAELLHKARTDFEQKTRELIESGEERLQTALMKLETARRADLAEVDERKNQQLQELVRAHEKAFEDLKSYYNDITLNNLGLLNGLKKEMEDLQQAKERAEKTAKDALAEKRKLADPLRNALDELFEVKKRALNADRDRAALVAKSKQLADTEKLHSKLTWDFEVLKQLYDKAIAQRDELNERFSKAALELQQRAALRGTLAKKCGRSDALRLEQ